MIICKERWYFKIGTSDRRVSHHLRLPRELQLFFCEEWVFEWKHFPITVSGGMMLSPSLTARRRRNGLQQSSDTSAAALTPEPRGSAWGLLLLTLIYKYYMQVNSLTFLFHRDYFVVLFISLVRLITRFFFSRFFFMVWNINLQHKRRKKQGGKH